MVRFGIKNQGFLYTKGKKKNKYVIVIALYCTFIYSSQLISQTAQDFLISCFQDEQKKGAKSIILSAYICSACRGEVTYEGFIFIKDTSEIYKVRYLKYIHRPASVKVLKDKTFIDDNIKSIFKIVEDYQDSIFWQISNMENLLKVRVVEDGKVMYRELLIHGTMRYLKINYNDRSATSIIHSIINLNEIFYKAYYYWLLNSAINNYINDIPPFRNEKKSGKK